LLLTGTKTTTLVDFTSDQRDMSEKKIKVYVKTVHYISWKSRGVDGIFLSW